MPWSNHLTAWVLSGLLSGFVGFFLYQWLTRVGL